MSCSYYEKYSLGKITEREFKKHLEHCEECNYMIQQDKKIEFQVKDIRTAFHPDILWQSIESSLITEKEKNKSNSEVYRMTFKIMRAAAILILVLVSGVIIKTNYFNSQSNLLSDSSIERYNKREKSCIRKIEHLEKNVQFSLNDGNIEQQLRYKEYLETVNSQIRDYHQALENNPANAHIRNYLIQALRSKKQVLKEFAQLQRNS